jgi:hypothetical protein
MVDLHGILDGATLSLSLIGPSKARITANFPDAGTLAIISQLI